tara:strand:- start:27 stop:719 length:693 start_codon:yes stop_codon:yes gene_type:complete
LLKKDSKEKMNRLKAQERKEVNPIQTFQVPFSGIEIKENMSIYTNTSPPGSKNKIISQAIKFHLQGNIIEAKKHYQYCLNQGLNDYRVFCNYGLILKQCNKAKEAKRMVQKGLTMNPNYAEGFSNLGAILVDLNEIEEAEKCFNKAIKLKPKLTDAYFNLGKLLMDYRTLEEAYYVYQTLINIDQNHSHAKAEIGKILLKQGNHREGLNKLREANGSIVFNHNKPSIIIS